MSALIIWSKRMNLINILMILIKNLTYNCGNTPLGAKWFNVAQCLNEKEGKKCICNVFPVEFKII